MSTVIKTDETRQVSAVAVGYYGRCDRCGEMADHSSRGTVEEALDDGSQCPCRDDEHKPAAAPTSLGEHAVGQMRGKAGPTP